VFQKVLLPAGAGIRTVDEQVGDSQRHETWRSEITAPAPVPNYEFLNVFYLTSAQTAQMPNTVLYEADQANMIGLKIEDPSHDIILMFSTDPTGAEPGGSIDVKLGMGRVGTFFLFNLKPACEYRVDVAAVGGFNRIHVAEGPGLRTTDAGVLHFEVGTATLAARGQ